MGIVSRVTHSGMSSRTLRIRLLELEHSFDHDGNHETGATVHGNAFTGQSARFSLAAFRPSNSAPGGRCETPDSVARTSRPMVLDSAIASDSARTRAAWTASFIRRVVVSSIRPGSVSKDNP